jgi:hypothetical protein
MAIKIPIITVFDSKGLKQAQFQLNKVRGNFQNLGRNAAIAGAAVGAFGAAIAVSARSLARIQAINIQTNTVLKSTGTTANGTAKDIENLAGSLEALTATEAETIQEGANLLLTFKNIQNQAGAGNDIFNQTTAAMVDVARAMGTSASGEAIRLGKALNDPVKGISALTRVGITFTEQQKAQIKALSDSGDIMGAQKIILAELQSQFGGSGAAFAKSFTGQLQLLQHELGTVGEEATMAVMPALQQMVDGFRELIPVVGPQLKAAIASVDWKAFAKSIVDTITFLVQNAEAIMKVVTALFVLNTTYNVVKVTTGLYNAAAVILGNTFTVTAGKIGLATGALKLFKIALITTGIGALVVALGLIIQGATEADSAYRKTTPVVTSFGTAVLNTGKDAEWAAGRYGTATTAVNNFNSAVSAMPKISRIDIPVVGGGRGLNLPAGLGSSGVIPPDPTTPPSTGGTSAAPRTTFAGILSKNLLEQTRLTKLQAKGLSEGAAELALSTITNKAQFKKLEANLSKATVVEKRQGVFNQTAAGRAELAQIQANNEANAAADRAAAEEAQRQRDAIIAAEKAAADERARIYKSFADSVTSTFGSIKDAIVGAFSLPELGGSTDSIIRNMDKLLGRVKSFSTNISQLSSMGLNPTLLSQVIQAGPVQGARLAASLVAGGADALGRINAGFGEIQTLGSEIGMTGTQSRFGTSQQQQIININIEGGLDSSAAIGKAVVDAVRAYERTSGAVWQGA